MRLRHRNVQNVKMRETYKCAERRNVFFNPLSIPSPLFLFIPENPNRLRISIFFFQRVYRLHVRFFAV